MELAHSNLIAAPAISGSEKVFVVVIGVVAIAALVFCYGLVREVLKADQGTAKMRDIAKAVQEGAAAYLNRQFRTLAVFSVIVFVVLIAPPGQRGRLERSDRARGLLPGRCNASRRPSVTSA